MEQNPDLLKRKTIVGLAFSQSSFLCQPQWVINLKYNSGLFWHRNYVTGALGSVLCIGSHATSSDHSFSLICSRKPGLTEVPCPQPPSGAQWQKWGMTQLPASIPVHLALSFLLLTLAALYSLRGHKRHFLKPCVPLCVLEIVITRAEELRAANEKQLKEIKEIFKFLLFSLFLLVWITPARLSMHPRPPCKIKIIMKSSS